MHISIYIYVYYIHVNIDVWLCVYFYVASRIQQSQPRNQDLTTTIQKADADIEQVTLFPIRLDIISYHISLSLISFSSSKVCGIRA